MINIIHNTRVSKSDAALTRTCSRGAVYPSPPAPWPWRPGTRCSPPWRGWGRTPRPPPLCCTQSWRARGILHFAKFQSLCGYCQMLSLLFQTWHYLLCTMLHLALSRLLWRDSVLRLLMVPESRDKVWHVEDTWPREPLRHEDWPLPSWHGGLLCLLQQDGASGGLSSEKDGLKWTNDGGYRIPDNIVEGGGGRASRQWSWDWFWCDRGRADVRVSKLCDNSITCHDCVTNLSLWRWCPLRRSTATLCLSLQNTRFVWIMSGL